jgi:glycogen synthase
MRILLTSHLFAPKIGGIETMSKLLAQQFVARGHEVHLLTNTPAESPADDLALTVIRRPTTRELLREVAWCEVCFHNNISLSFGWPLLFGPRPWIVTTQTWIARHDGKLGWREHLKRLFLRRAHSVAISRAIADSLPGSSELIPNTYDSAVFQDCAKSPRNRDLVFAGRLVSDKGVDLAIEALGMLAAQNLRPTLTIIGEGPERARLESQVSRLKLKDQVEFIGSRQGVALAWELQQHRIQIVPSRWAEPFGIVALEGAACGCLVLGSKDGGLGDAIGPCGFTFPNGDAGALASLIAKALKNELSVPDQDTVQSHLRKYHLDTVTEAYLALFERLSPTTE